MRKHDGPAHKKWKKRKRKLLEAAYIATFLVTNHREGFVSLSRSAAKLMLMDESALPCQTFAQVILNE